MSLIKCSSVFAAFFIFEVVTSLSHCVASLSMKVQDNEELRLYLILPLFQEFSRTNMYSKLQVPYANSITGICKASVWADRCLGKIFKLVLL